MQTRPVRVIVLVVQFLLQVTPLLGCLPGVLGRRHFSAVNFVIHARSPAGVRTARGPFNAHWASGMDRPCRSVYRVMADDIELSPTKWVRDQTQQILEQGTTDGIEILDRPIILLTVTGAKSGKQHYVPLMRVEKDGRYAIVASKGGAPAHPSWYFNVKANPALTLQDGDKVVAVTAREIEGPEREQWWRLAVEAFPPYAEYQTKTARQIPVFVLE